MRRTHSLARMACIVIGLAIAVVLACDDDTTSPPPPTPSAMDRAWPNADSLEWDYALTMKGWTDSTPDSLYATPEEVPPLPPLQDLAAQLATPIPAPPDSLETVGYVLRFDGTATTNSGITGQNLVSQIVLSASAAESPSRTTLFLHRLAAARPELRPRIAATYPAAWNEKAGPTIFPLPLFLSGGVYEKTAAHIGAYGDLDSLLAWKWLETDVTTGHEFALQLVPSLSDDIFLHARVLGSRMVIAPLITYQVLDVLYAVDYGVTAVVDDTQQNLGYVRLYDYGSVAYAADVGPIESVERHDFPDEPLPDPIFPSLVELTLQYQTPVLWRK